MSTDVTTDIAENLRFVAEWLAHEVPGPQDWAGRTLEVRPAPDAVLARCSVVAVDGSHTVPWVLPLDHGVARAVLAVQAAMADPVDGSWLAATIDVDPGGTAMLTIPEGRPAVLVPGRDVTKAELEAHLAQFPAAGVDDWMLEVLDTQA